MAIDISKKGGQFQGNPHSKGGIPIVVSDTKAHIEVEGLEPLIPKEAIRDDTVRVRKGTNLEILDDINKKVGAKGMDEPAKVVESGDVVICKKSAHDTEEHTYKGTDKEIVHQINTGGGCNPIVNEEGVHREGGEIVKVGYNKYINKIKTNVSSISKAIRKWLTTNKISYEYDIAKTGSEYYMFYLENPTEIEVKIRLSNHTKTDELERELSGIEYIYFGEDSGYLKIDNSQQGLTSKEIIEMLENVGKYSILISKIKADELDFGILYAGGVEFRQYISKKYSIELNALSEEMLSSYYHSILIKDEKFIEYKKIKDEQKRIEYEKQDFFPIERYVSSNGIVIKTKNSKTPFNWDFYIIGENGEEIKISRKKYKNNYDRAFEELFELRKQYEKDEIKSIISGNGEVRGGENIKTTSNYIRTKEDASKMDKGTEPIEAKEESNAEQLKKGGEISLEQKEEIYKKWKSLVNMSFKELRNFYDSKEGKEAGLSKEKADELGIHYGRESARWVMKMKTTRMEEWSPTMWEWAKRQIAFVSRMSGNKGELYDEKGRKTRKHLSLLIWGHNPEKYEYGGAIKDNELEKGIAVEQEHRKTFERLKNGEISIEEAIKETAMEHISENPNYYSQLLKMEHKNK